MTLVTLVLTGCQASCVALLGAEKGPRLRAHPGVEHRFTASNPNEGLPARVKGNPEERRKDLQARSATYTLEDYDSPDLTAVLDDIALEKDGVVRRRRAAALLRVLGRSWRNASCEKRRDAV
ncbi:hypothetical protein DSC45_13395 [Streptomyces sp. YIM 130001]|uniref:hypothetical protein n=1 Tax=Streptomyces sp. YIM 130001 TaxID=2259644 RepID=UPI000E65B569|nr:hypothetical protein [Streptomyces sp. YIM 130001]RII17893.1 hypothetical protein DSC45_13395 [Streptomyces sp. YIM 130001]